MVKTKRLGSGTRILTDPLKLEGRQRPPGLPVRKPESHTNGRCCTAFSRAKPEAGLGGISRDRGDDRPTNTAVLGFIRTGRSTMNFIASCPRGRRARFGPAVAALRAGLEEHGHATEGRADALGFFQGCLTPFRLPQGQQKLGLAGYAPNW